MSKYSPDWDVTTIPDNIWFPEAQRRKRANAGNRGRRRVVTHTTERFCLCIDCRRRREAIAALTAHPAVAPRTGNQAIEALYRLREMRGPGQRADGQPEQLRQAYEFRAQLPPDLRELVEGINRALGII